MLEVEDDGIGIPLSEHPHLFERFFRGSSPMYQAIPGSGLGLAIVKAITDARGGGITVASEEGCGTTFRVYLPLRQATTAGSPSERGPADGAAAPAGRHGRRASRRGCRAAEANSPS